MIYQINLRKFKIFKRPLRKGSTYCNLTFILIYQLEKVYIGSWKVKEGQARIEETKGSFGVENANFRI